MAGFPESWEETLWSIEPKACFQKTLLCIWFWEFSYRIIRLVCPVMKNHKVHSPERFLEIASIKANTAFHSLIIGPFSAYGLFSDEKMMKIVDHLRAFDTVTLSKDQYIFYETETTWVPILTPLSVSFFVWELIYVNKWEVFDIPMVCHHILAIISWPL